MLLTLLLREILLNMLLLLMTWRLLNLLRKLIGIEIGPTVFPWSMSRFGGARHVTEHLEVKTSKIL